MPQRKQKPGEIVAKLRQSCRARHLVPPPPRRDSGWRTLGRGHAVPDRQGFRTSPPFAANRERPTIAVGPGRFAGDDEAREGQPGSPSQPPGGAPAKRVGCPLTATAQPWLRAR